MSFGILQSFLSRLKKYGMADKLPELETIYRQFQAQENRYEQVTFEIKEEERPPMITIPEYLERRKSLGGTGQDGAAS